ncbi:MAG TPA: ornithine cyclodeaminase family protein [Desulfobacterales bacterium]|nr:ornithine cyclodeaminase family protein [Desulfobacterales bacterium]
MNILYLKRSEVESLITQRDVISMCEKVFKTFEEGASLQECHLIYFKPGYDPFKEPITDALIVKPVYSKSLNIAGGKNVFYFLANAEKGLPINPQLTYLSDVETGAFLAVMRGDIITQLRTSGNSAVAAKYLARRDSSSIAIIGCGAQGKGHLLAMRELFNIKDIRIYDIRKEAMGKYIDEMGERLNVDIKASDNPKDAVQGADIVCMVTTAAKPLVFEEWIERGCFVSAVHAFSDFDVKFTKKADKFLIGERKSDVNYLSSKFKEFSESDVYGAIGEIILGKKPGRTNDDERTLFVHPGVVGTTDLALASIAYERAKEEGVGINLEP